jgi:PAS domain S-box-containing protein
MNADTVEANSPLQGPGQLGPELSQEILRRQFRLLIDHVPIIIFGNLVLGMLIAFVFADVASPATLWLWLGLLAISLFPTIRAWAKRKPGPPRRVSARFHRRAFANAILTALPWGLAPFLFLPTGAPDHVLALVFVVAGLTAGTTAALSAVPAVCWGYLVTVVTPMALHLVLPGQRVQVVMGLMLLCYLAFIYAYQQRAWRAFLANAQADLEKSRLLAELMEARESLSATAAELEQRVAERTAALRASEARLNGFLRNAPVTMSVKDLDGRYQLVNPRSEAFLERPASEVIGRRTLELAGTAGHAAVVALEREAVATNRTQVQHIQYGQGPHAQWFIDVKFPIHDADGRITAIGGIGLDITEQKRTEGLLAQAQKMEAIGSLTGGIAHDFNNYLGIVIGNLDLLKERCGDDPAVARLIGNALDGALTGAELVRRLLAFSRRQTLDPTPTDINARIQAVQPLLERAVPETVQISLSLASGLSAVLIDGPQLDSCLVNLVNNARDAMPAGGRLSISTGRVRVDEAANMAASDIAPGDYVVIQVSDTGTGMAPDVVAKAFDPFFTTKGLAHGTGLGLSMVYGFVKQSNGHVRIYSEIGHGTTVRMYLPAAPGVSAAAPAAEPTDVPTGSETILLVEDSAPVRTTVAAQLNSLGYRTIEAESGEAALAILDKPEPPIDLVLTDFVMPGAVDGRTLVELAPTRRPRIKVLLTSGFAGDALRGRDGGGAKYRLLAKPFRRDQLARSVRAALDGEGS